MVLPINGSTHLIPAYYSFIDPERMKGWVGLVGWTVADGLPTLVVTHQLQVECRTGKVRQPETDVLPLCHATTGADCDCKMLSFSFISVKQLLNICMPPLVAQMDRRHYVFGLSVRLSVPVSMHTCVRAETFLLPSTYSFKFLNVFPKFFLVIYMWNH